MQEFRLVKFNDRWGSTKHAIDPRRYLTRKAGAKLLNVHPDTLYRWAVEEGLIPYSQRKKGAELRFLHTDLVAYQQSCRIPTVEETKARRR